MRLPPTPRREVFDLYWYFASERQQIFERRVAGQSGPWTTDPILACYKFCNVFRAADRVSQYLIHDVAYSAEPDDVNDRIFQIVAFRTFSNVATWRGLRALLGRSPRVEDLETDRFRRALEGVRDMNGRLYTGAFILCASNAYGMHLKHLNHVELFRDMFLRRTLASRIVAARSLGEVYAILHELPLMGDFMSYQTAIDLNYSSLVNFSENDFTRPGPGAVRGLRKVFVDLRDYSPEEAILWMVDRQNEEFARLGLVFNGLWGRPLSAVDCQGLFCEVDKYCREALPQLKSARVRIKSRFDPALEPLDLFFPPKWGLNHLLAPKVAAHPNKRTSAERSRKVRRPTNLENLGLELGE
jgi:hypothetical protein